MQISLDIGKLKTRAREAGITMAVLCKAAEVSVSTPSRILRKGGKGHTHTITKLYLALHRLEREKLKQLAARVPVEGGDT